MMLLLIALTILGLLTLSVSAGTYQVPPIIPEPDDPVDGCVIHHPQNGLCSFSDIWEGEMPGYLIWFNARLVEETAGRVFPLPDFTIEHWEVYEAEWLSMTPDEQLRECVLAAFEATSNNSEPRIHGTKGSFSSLVSEPDQRKR